MLNACKSISQSNFPEGLAQAQRALAYGLRPPVRTALSQWAEQRFRLSSESSAETGLIRLRPYQRRPLDCMSPQSEYETCVLMWASQLGKTVLEMIYAANLIETDPGPMLVVQPTLPMAEAWSKERLAPMIRDNEYLRAKVADPKSRDSGSTIYHRRFYGGHISIVGSNSPAGLASRPIRHLLFDEVDRFEASAGAEGDPVKLAMARTRTFWNRKVLMVSSPTEKGVSKIHPAFLEGTQERYHVPCPHCGHRQALWWDRVEWPDDDPTAAYYRCESCEQPIDHSFKAQMVAAGDWVAANPGARIYSSHLSELYSLNRSWGEMAVDYLSAQGNPEAERTFLNTSLAELWDDEAADDDLEHTLYARRESYGPELPAAAIVLTAGVDVQANRLELSLWNWGAGEESWLIEHRVFDGETTRTEVWDALDEYLLGRYPHPVLGRVPIQATAIDCGYLPDVVMRFAERRRGRRVWAVKGHEGDRPIWPKRQSKTKHGSFFIVGINSARTLTHGRLRIAEGPGAMHFPLSVEMPYFEQLNSEFLETKIMRGRPRRNWVRRRDRRAETWDCANYALAALRGLQTMTGLNLDLEAAKIAAAAAPPEPPAPAAVASDLAPVPVKRPGFGTRPGGWFTR